MADYAAIRDGLKTTLETISAVKVAYDTVPDRVIVPSCVVQPGSPVVEYHQSMEGAGGNLQLFHIDVVALAGRFEPGAGQDVLDAMISGSGSVEAAVRADPQLSDSALFASVIRCVDYGNITVGDTIYYGCRFQLEVYAR
tara:strand:+ start:345 stop:764 length:420 start_codon:yes stop_codon:yes gene_type:complete